MTPPVRRTSSPPRPDERTGLSPASSGRAFCRQSPRRPHPAGSGGKSRICGTGLRAYARLKLLFIGRKSLRCPRKNFPMSAGKTSLSPHEISIPRLGICIPSLGICIPGPGIYIPSLGIENSSPTRKLFLRTSGSFSADIGKFFSLMSGSPFCRTPGAFFVPKPRFFADSDSSFIEKTTLIHTGKRTAREQKNTLPCL